MEPSGLGASLPTQDCCAVAWNCTARRAAKSGPVLSFNTRVNPTQTRYTLWEFTTVTLRGFVMFV